MQSSGCRVQGSGFRVQGESSCRWSNRYFRGMSRGLPQKSETKFVKHDYKLEKKCGFRSAAPPARPSTSELPCKCSESSPVIKFRRHNSNDMQAPRFLWEIFRLNTGASSTPRAALFFDASLEMQVLDSITCRFQSNPWKHKSRV